MAKYILEIEQDESEMRITELAWKITEKEIQMELSLRQLFNVAMINLVSPPRRSKSTETKAPQNTG